MSQHPISRREFIKGSAAALFGMAAACMFGNDVLPFEKVYGSETVDSTSLAVYRDTSKCIGCGKCVEMCSDRQGLDILELADNNGKKVSSVRSGYTLSESKCIGCGQCARHCPSGAITVKDGLSKVNEALNSSKYKYIVWQFAPSAQHIIGEEFRMLTGQDATNKIAASVKALGSERNLAYSTDFGADMTIMEEATEFVEAYREGNKKPFMTSCCPGWINYVELNCPEIIPHLSSCKSPMEMFGSLIKDYLPIQRNVSASEIFTVAVMPCTAKKHECGRDEMKNGTLPSIDAVLTVVEFKNLMVSKGIDLAGLADAEYDELFSGTSGAGRIFGATGGVCEAAMRTAYYLINNSEPPESVLAQLKEDLRGNKDGGYKTKTTELKINDDITVKACVVNGIKNIKSIVSEINAGVCDYDFIEVMTCPGGCSGGGGTPVLFASEGVRHRGIYDYDTSSRVVSSHNNTVLDNIYKNYLGGSPGSEKAEELLHTAYNSNRR